MELTRPASFIHNEDDRTYIVVATISPELRQAIARVQHALDEAFPGSLWLMPQESLHITLFEIMQRGQFPFDKDEFFNAQRDKIESGLDKIFQNMTRWQVLFDALIVSPDAITVQSSDATEFNAIRAAITEELPIPTETKTPPPIVHSTIARFTKEIEVATVRTELATIAFHAQESITNFELRRTTKQPMLAFDTLKTYALM